MFTAFRQKRDRANELALLDRGLDRVLANRTVPALPELVQCDTRKAVWQIDVPQNASCYMSAESGHIDDILYVVQLDTEAFYRAWLHSTHTAKQERPDDCRLRRDMPLDYKFHRAAEGFAQGRQNPVPLAELSVYAHDHRLSIGFTNGVTRTFWLIANHAASFPAMVPGEHSARLLNDAAGLTPSPIPYGQIFTANLTAGQG